MTTLNAVEILNINANYLFMGILASYIVGSVSFGVLASRIFKLGDLTKIGSGNIGATNVMRTGNKMAAFFTLIGDCLKGLLAVELCKHFFKHYSRNFPPNFSQVQNLMESNVILTETLTVPFSAILGAVGLAAIIGHIFPIWLKFRGGKGIATTIGVYFGWHPALGLSFLIVWIAFARMFKKSSLSGLMGIISALITSIILCIMGSVDKLTVFYILIVSTIVILKHRDNILRLINGKEGNIKL